MIGVTYIAEIASLIGDPARANMLFALKDDGVLSATELSYIAGVAPNTASGHLAKLMQANMVTVERKGRHRFYRLAGAELAEALEALQELAVIATPRSHRPDPRGDAIRFARVCYDHLAGELGIKLAGSLVSLGYLGPPEDGFVLRKKGEAALVDLGIDLNELRAGRRRFVRLCLDWSGRRPHLGGALGASLCSRLKELGWVRRGKSTRAVFVTNKGRQGFRDWFDIEVPAGRG